MQLSTPSLKSLGYYVKTVANGSNIETFETYSPDDVFLGDFFTVSDAWICAKVYHELQGQYL